MMSYNALVAARSRESGVLFVQLLTFSHSSLTNPIRITNVGQNFISRGNQFINLHFDIGLPGDRAEGIVQPTELTVSNVDLSVIAELRTVVGYIEVTHELVTEDTPDTVEAQWIFDWKRTRYDDLTIRGELTFDSVLDEQYPWIKHTPENTPTLF